MKTAPALILNYHRVAEGPDPLLQCVTPTHFAEHVDRLARVATIVPLVELDHAAPEPRVAITFDDGYADNADTAAPILSERRSPATFFVPSRILDERREHWWDRLEHIVAGGRTPTSGFVDLRLAGRRVRVDVRSADGRARALKTVNHRLRSRAMAEIEPALADLAAQLDSPETAPCERHRLMDEPAIAGLAAQRDFEIGSHGITHTMLSALDGQALAREITASRERLGTSTGRPVTSIAYPYGTADSFGRDTTKLARRAGYARACANTAGAVRRAADRFALPRCMVYDWDGDELEARVRSWFATL